jgi:hypothetical protein
MRVLAVVPALTLAVTAPAAGAPSLASSGCPLFPADNGVVAASLAFRQVTRHFRRGRHPAASRHAPGSRHARTGGGPRQDQAGPAPPGPHQVPPDPDPAGPRRP